ncbi:MAG: prepilin-type N-terminal cleavage/methylation domain-containing protein [Deltaproteobacteria bacterium]|nr:prepilin-type N-terminal cleavage/methylation domain-containing protein [Deltaproteobacteria bacterium]
MTLNKKGFTLVEMMVVFAIIGILAATAIPAYSVIRQRIYGSEAKVMLYQIINAQIAYCLENNKYFGEVGKPLTVYHDGQDSKDAQEEIYKNLNLEIPIGHFVDYDLRVDEKGNFILIINSHGDENFSLFNGASQITVTLDKNGVVDIQYL